MKLPEGAASDVVAPHPHFDQKQRQQAVVWLAQDVYAARLEKVHDGDDHLRMLKLWRDLIVFLNDWPGHTKMQELLVEAWGRTGAELVGEMDNDNWKLFLHVGSE
jgi:hypothetical protein